MQKEKVNYEAILTKRKETVIYVIIISKKGVDLLSLRDFLIAVGELEKKVNK